MILSTNLINIMSQEFKRDELLAEAYATAVTKYDISDNYKHLIPQQDLPKIRLLMSELKRGIPPKKANITAYLPIIEMIDRIVENGPEAVRKFKELAFQGDHIAG